MYNLEVAVSTLNDGIYNIKFRSDYNYLVIHQVTNGYDYSNFINQFSVNVRYIISNEKGLSKSRNLALDNAIGDYVWIMDDDVLIHDRAYHYIMSLIKQNSNYGMFVVSHSHKDIEYISGVQCQNVSSISAANVSSIDMIINRIRCGNLRFDERFGLGTGYSSGEEYIFTCNLIASKQKVLKSRFVCTYHPLISSGNDFYSTPNKLKTKLEMFKVANGVLKGYLYYFSFLVKKSRVICKNKAYLNVLMSFF